MAEDTDLKIAELEYENARLKMLLKKVQDNVALPPHLLGAVKRALATPDSGQALVIVNRYRHALHTICEQPLKQADEMAKLATDALTAKP